jgi:hypothetical protein
LNILRSEQAFGGTSKFSQTSNKRFMTDGIFIKCAKRGLSNCSARPAVLDLLGSGLPKENVARMASDYTMRAKSKRINPAQLVGGKSG